MNENLFNAIACNEETEITSEMKEYLSKIVEKVKTKNDDGSAKITCEFSKEESIKVTSEMAEKLMKLVFTDNKEPVFFKIDGDNETVAFEVNRKIL